MEMKTMKKLTRALLLVLALLACMSAPVSAKTAAKVKMNKTKVTLTAGKTVTLKLTNNKKKVKWSTSNKKIATVSSKGKVTAKKKGTAKITAKVGKKKYTCKVTVKAAKKTTAKQNDDEQTQSADQNDNNVCKIYGHTWGSPTVKLQPTCATEGYYTHTCIWCGTTEKVSTPKTMGHMWQATSHHAPTQKENWVCDTVKCTLCGATSEEKCLDPGAPGHLAYWTLPGGEAEALNRIKLYRQNQDKIHDPNNFETSNCEGWIIELNEYIWQIAAFGSHPEVGRPGFAPEGSTKRTYASGDPGLQYYPASLYDPLYDLRVGDGIHLAHGGNYYTDKDGNRVRSGHWVVITSITRDASGKMISYHTAECGDMDSRLKGIPDWHDDKPDYDPNSIGGLVQEFNSGKIDKVMTFWPDIWDKLG